MTKQHHDRVKAPAGGGQDRPSGSPVHPDIDTLQPAAASADQLEAELNRRQSQSLQPQSQEPEPLLSLRATVILLLALLIGVAAGVLTYLGGQPVPAAVLMGGGAAGAALALFHNLIGRW